MARLEQAGFGIEEGGFGKGIALRSAVAAALDAGAECVVLDFGGQVSMNGSCGATWVDIAHPDDRHRGLARLEIGAGSVATSGNSERGLVIDGVRHGHILDPRSGRPVVDWGTVTVVADDPVTADCLSTALYVMGPRQGIEWLRNRPEVDAVFIERSGEDKFITATAGLQGRLEVFGWKVGYLRAAEPGIAENSH
jgi:thiamine biosynthesis lipoprotein